MPQSALSRAACKSPEHNLAARLDTEAGLNPAQARVAIDLFARHQQAYHGEFRAPGNIVHTAVSAKEPAGKPIKHCRTVAVELTWFHPADVELCSEHGTVWLRATRLYRMACQAWEQGGLLSYEDLALLLGVNTSTVKDLVRRLRERGLQPPTRGAIKDIGPGTSHKAAIARLLGLGFTTTEIRAMTRHGEHAIGRYQHQYGLVLHLLHRYPDAPDNELRLLSGLSAKAWEVYAEIAREQFARPECLSHLERLRRRFEMDPEHLSGQIPPGKRPRDIARKRLEQQHLGTAFRQTIQEDLATTRRVAQAVTDDLLGLLEQSFPLADSLRPGELVIFADAHDPDFISGEKVTDRPVIPVTVPIHTEQAQEIWRGDESASRRRARIAILIASAAWEQGGVMTVAGLAELLHTTPGTMSKDLRTLAVEAHVQAPTKGWMEDAGATVTHKDLIVGYDQYGLTGEEIAWLTRHSPISRDRYVKTYRRAEALMRLEGRIPTAKELARILRLRRHVAEQYVQLLRRFHGDGEDDPALAASPTGEPSPSTPATPRATTNVPAAHEELVSENIFHQ